MSVDPETFSAKQAEARTRLPYALIDAYARGARPVVPPFNQGGLARTGRGTPRRYSFRGLIALRAADELRAFGVRTSLIRALAHFIENEAIGIDTEEAVRTHSGLWLSVPFGRGSVGKPLAISSRSEAKRLLENGMPVTLVIDVIALARQLGARTNRKFRIPARKRAEK